MNVSFFKLFGNKGAVLTMCGFLSMFGMAGFAGANCVTGTSVLGPDPSVFTLLIDSTSNCGNMSGNMYGCDVDATGSCTITNPNTSETITVSLTSGAVGSNTPLDWSTLDPSLVDFVIVVGATGGGTCGFSYTPGSDFGAGLGFLKSNGTYQKVNSVSFCSDFAEPAPDVPRLIVTKTVTTAADDTCSSDTDSLDTGAGADVRYCYIVENVGAGLAESVTLDDDAGTPGDTSDDFSVTLTGLNSDGSLSSGGTATGMSGLVTIAQAGTVVNTATASATGLGGTVTVTAIDTATVNAVLVAEICPDNFQQAVNQLSQSTGLDYAFLLDPNQGGRLSVCAPNGLDSNGNPDPNIAKAIRIGCVDQCVTKPICQTDPSNSQCFPSVCEPSGSWTADDVNGNCAPVTTTATDPLPYCWEVQQDLNKDCVLNEWDPQEETMHHIKKGHVNPYVYQSCYSSGGRYVCETMCFSFSAADALDCPPGSTVF